jgi:hypothetical protein
MSQDKTAEKLRACRDAFEREYRCEGASFRKTNGDYTGPLNTFWEVWQTAWRANTRADSGEAVACRYRYHGPNGLIGNWTTGDLEDADSLRVDARFEIEPLFTHPRATSVDVRDAERWQAFKRYVSETIGGNHLLDRLAILDIGSWDKCIDELKAAIVSREGEKL